MKALNYMIAVAALLLFAAACATPPEDEPVEIPDNLAQLQAEAQELQATIEQYGLAEYEPDEFGLGEAAYLRAQDEVADDPQNAADSYEEAIGHYGVVISRGFPTLLVDRQSEVEGARQSAIDSRARTAATASFEEAEEVLATAIELREAGSYEDSFATFADAEERFNSSRETAERRRDEARAALDRLDQRMRETESEASDLEQELEEEEAEIEDEE